MAIASEPTARAYIAGRRTLKCLGPALAQSVTGLVVILLLSGSLGVVSTSAAGFPARDDAPAGEAAAGFDAPASATEPSLGEQANETPSDEAEAGALVGPGLNIPAEITTQNSDIIIRNYGTEYGVSVADPESLNRVTAFKRQQAIERGTKWTPLVVEVYDHFTDPPGFVVTDRLTVPEVHRFINGREVTGGLETFGFYDVTDQGTEVSDRRIRVRVTFDGEQTTRVFSGQFYPDDDNAPWRRTRADVRLSQVLAWLIDFNSTNSLRWPRERDAFGVSFLKLDPYIEDLMLTSVPVRVVWTKD